MPKKLVRQVADYCWSNKFLDVFRKFFVDHADAFEHAPVVIPAGEHNLEYYTLFQEYLKIYEEMLETYINSLDCDIAEFYREVRETQQETDDPYLLTFIDCLLASCDYESFYKVMAREGRKRAAAKLSQGGVADAKAEAKSPQRESKGDFAVADVKRSEGKDSK